MKKLIIALMTFTCMTVSAFAQQEDYARFIIRSAKNDGVDYSDLYQKEGAFVVFYNSDAGNLCMANVMSARNSQSYGPVSRFTSNHIEETLDTYEADIFTFVWDYKNSYDDNSGYASCKLTKIYKEAAVTYNLKIVTESGSKIEFEGYMEGSLALPGEGKHRTEQTAKTTHQNFTTI